MFSRWKCLSPSRAEQQRKNNWTSASRPADGRQTADGGGVFDPHETEVARARHRQKTVRSALTKGLVLLSNRASRDSSLQRWRFRVCFRVRLRLFHYLSTSHGKGRFTSLHGGNSPAFLPICPVWVCFCLAWRRFSRPHGRKDPRGFLSPKSVF